MKKLYAAICLTSALLLSGCKFFLNQNDDETNKKTPDPKPTFEYTANNDVPASKVPFDKKLCYVNADSLVFSDGDWTIVECLENPDFYNEKAIAKASAKDNTLTINSGILKLDIPFDSEEDRIEELPASEDDFKTVFTDIQKMWTTYGFEDASKYTLKYGYLTKDNTIVLILDATEYNKEVFDLDKLKTGTIKSNPNKTKYVVTLKQEQSGREIPVYIYKDAYLNDKETIPENLPEDDTQDDLTDIVKALDYSECKTSLTKDELSFADGDWEIVVDEETLIFSKLGTQRTFLTGTTKNNNLELKSGKGYFFISTSYYENSGNKKTEFKADLDYFKIKQNKILMNDKYLVNDLGDLTDSELSTEEELLSITNLSSKYDLDIKTNDKKSKYKLSYGNYQYGKCTIYFNKVGGEETQVPPAQGNEDEENPLEKLYTSENDVPAISTPFTADTCPFTGSALVFSNGNWTLEDIFTESGFSAKTITKITYDNTQSNPYNCTSMVYKFDFPKAAGTTTVDYKSYFEKIRNHNDLAAIKDILTFSHGYMTDTSIVIIAETPVEVCQTMYLSKLDLIPLNIIFANPTKSKYYINYGLYEKLYVYKDSDELTSEESNVILQITQFETQTNSLITQNVSAGLTTITLTDNDFDNFGYYQMKNTNLSLSDGNYTCIQKTVYALNEGSSQKGTTQFDFSLENGSPTFISGKSVYIVDLSFFELMLAQEADEKLIQEYLALSSDKEKFNFIMSSSGIPIPENMKIVFDNGEILEIEELNKIPSNFIYTISNESETKYLFSLTNIIKKDTIIKKTSDGNFMFETTEVVHGTNDTTITYLIKNN